MGPRAGTEWSAECYLPVSLKRPTSAFPLAPPTEYFYKILSWNGQTRYHCYCLFYLTGVTQRNHVLLLLDFREQLEPSYARPIF